MNHVERSCAHCGQRFKPRRSDQIYCGSKCKQKSSYARNKQVVQRACPQCGNEIPKESRTNTLFCSTKCKQRYHYEIKTGQQNTGIAEQNPTQATSEQELIPDVDRLEIETLPKSDQIVEAILQWANPLTAREILDEIGIDDTEENRLILRRKLNALPGIEEIETDKQTAYRVKPLQNYDTDAVDTQTNNSYIPHRLIPKLVKDAPKNRIEVDTRTLEEYLAGQAPTPLPANEILTDEVKSCFKVAGGVCLITASWGKNDDSTYLVKKVISAINAAVPLLFACAGDLVISADPVQPESRAIQVRKIILENVPGRTVRLRRGWAWGTNDWKLTINQMQAYRVPDDWDTSWWAD